MKIKLIIIKINLITAICSLFLTGCIETPQDAMDHYNQVGAKQYAEDMLSWNSYQVMTPVFNDSIFPKIVNELSFEELAEISEIVKGHSTYRNFTQVNLPHGKMLRAFNRLDPIAGSHFYMRHYKTFKGLPEVFQNKVLPSYLSKIPFKDVLKIYAIVKPAGLGGSVASYKYNPHDVLKYFQSLSMLEGAKAYYHLQAIPVVDSIYSSYILPHVVDTHYLLLKESKHYFNKTKYSHLINDAVKVAKIEYLTNIKEDLNEYQDKAVEALDNIVLPNIEYELDSISKEEADKLTDKFIGGFLNFRELALTFGRNEKKFKELWNKHVHSEKYDECIDRHITIFLDEIFSFQKDYYTEITNKERKKTVFPFMSEPILIKYPQNTRKIQEYIKSNKFGYVAELAEWLPWGVGDVMSISNEVIDAIEDENADRLEDKDAFIIFCQQLILGQISDAYYKNFRKQALNIIDISYNRLYNDITKQI